LESYIWDGCPKEEEVYKDDEIESTYVTVNMTLKTPESASSLHKVYCKT
jgi:hypothetical protein